MVTGDGLVLHGGPSLSGPEPDWHVDHGRAMLDTVHRGAEGGPEDPLLATSSRSPAIAAALG